MTIDAQMFALFAHFEEHFAAGFSDLHTFYIPVDFVSPARYTWQAVCHLSSLLLLRRMVASIQHSNRIVAAPVARHPIFHISASRRAAGTDFVSIGETAWEFSLLHISP
jgi:hypothetical protein